MNIFYLDTNPGFAAQYHNDKHVVKMILETAQLLSTAHHELSQTPPEGIYKPTHKNHPCAIWVRSSSFHYRWAFDLFVDLLNEYEHRYLKIHATTRLVAPLYATPVAIPTAGWSDPPQCMPDDCKVENDPVAAYRNYYMKHKSDLAKWKNRSVPYWYQKP